MLKNGSYFFTIALLIQPTILPMQQLLKYRFTQHIPAALKQYENRIQKRSLSYRTIDPHSDNTQAQEEFRLAQQIAENKHRVGSVAGAAFFNTFFVFPSTYNWTRQSLAYTHKQWNKLSRFSDLSSLLLPVGLSIVLAGTCLTSGAYACTAPFLLRSLLKERSRLVGTAHIYNRIKNW